MAKRVLPSANQHAISEARIQRAFYTKLLPWFDKHGRHDLPWQTDRSFYRVWVSEIMLQQTQVVTVIPYFERFMKRLPTVQSLARASADEVLELWSGLGYYARARHLHAAAQSVVQGSTVRWPQTREEWQALKGVGPSTAGAIVAQVLDQREPILDGNVKRVLSRVFAVDVPKGQSVDELWRCSHWVTPKTRPADFTQAMMDLGATLCTRTRPRCEQCPVGQVCRAYQAGEPTAYPIAVTVKPKKIERFVWLQLVTAHSIYLKVRPNQGLWGGLWGLLEFDSKQSMLAWKKQQKPLDRLSVEPLPPFKHVFTHRLWEITPFRIHCPKVCTLIGQGVESGEWVKHQDVFKRGLAAPVSKLLQSR